MATTEELLTQILESLEEGNEASLENNRLSNQFLAQMQKAAGIPGNVQQPFAFIGILSDNINQQKTIFNQLQKSSLAFGTSVNNFKNISSVSRGAKDFGPSIALNTAIDALATGTLGLSENTFNLGLEMRAVGESSRSLFELQRTLISQGGLSISQMDSLASELKESRDQYGLSTEMLVDSIEILSQNLSQFSLMGITDELSTVITDFSQKYGAGNKQLIENMVNTLFTGDRLKQFSVLGVMPEIASLQQTPSLGGIEQVADKIAVAVENLLRQFQSQGDLPSVAFQRMENILGKGVAQIVQFSKLKPQAPVVGGVEDSAEAIKKQEAIQKEIGLHLFEANQHLAQMLAGMSSNLHAAMTSIGVAISSGFTLSKINQSIHSVLDHLQGKAAKDITGGDKLISKVSGWSSSVGKFGIIAGGITGLVGLGKAGMELWKSIDDDSSTQTNTLELMMSGLFGLIGAMGPIAQLFPALGGLLPVLTSLSSFLFLNPIGISILALAGAIAGVAYAMSDSDKDKSQQVQKVTVVDKPSPTVTSSPFLAANTELTRSLLNNVFNQNINANVVSQLKVANKQQEIVIDLLSKQLRKPIPGSVLSLQSTPLGGGN